MHARHSAATPRVKSTHGARSEKPVSAARNLYIPKQLVLSTTSFYLLDGNKLGGLLDDKGKGERCPGRSCANG